MVQRDGVRGHPGGEFMREETPPAYLSRFESAPPLNEQLSAF